MLVAMTDQNQPLVLQSSMPKDLLRQLRKERQFFCPQCKKSVYLKIGDIKIPHFAHRNNSECESQFSEGETEQHLLGKEHLYQLLKKLGFQVELESYLSSLKQRPDLLLAMNDGKRMAIEYQCSSISKEYFMFRNKGYFSENIEPFWIPSTPAKKNTTTGIMTISLSDQLQQFVLSTKTQNYLLTYNPHQRKFVYFSNLLHMKGNQFLSKIQHLPLENQQFPFYLPKNITRNEFAQYCKTYHDSMRKYLRYRLFLSKKGVNDIFLRSIYELRLTLSALPSFIGVPLKGNESLGQLAVEWQTALFHFMYINRIEIASMNRQAVIYFLKFAKLSISNESITIVINYCKLLIHLNIEHIYSSVDKEKLLKGLYTQFLA